MRRWVPPVLLVLALAVPAAFRADESAASGESATPAAYGELLADHVIATPNADGGMDTRFDYAALRADPGQEVLRREIREAFLSVDPGALSTAARRAWAINAYNFLVVDLVTENLVGEDGITLASIADIGAGDFAVFDEPRFAVAGVTYSLNGFEHHYLFDDIDRASGTAPESLDPRIHFALVCAARGCPPILKQPFMAATLDAQLDRATRNALFLPHHLTRKGPVLLVSKVFEWYAADFGGPDGRRSFLVNHAPEPVGKALADGLIEAVLTEIEWDWTLNIAR